MLVSHNPDQLTKKEELNTNILLVEDDLDFGAAVKRESEKFQVLAHFW